MRAVICPTYGEAPVLETVDVPDVGAGQVRIRVAASVIRAGDLMMAQGYPSVMRPVFTGMLRPGPPILGLDVAGVIEAVGDGVSEWSVGDRVVGELPHAWAEQIVTDPAKLARIPNGVDFMDAAALPVSGRTALQGLRAGAVQAGERVLVVGASGGVGHLAVQIAKHLGAHVTGVCSAAKADVVRAAGADAVIAYDETSFTAHPEPWDVIFDLAGHEPLSACLTALRPDGRYVSGAGRTGGPWLGPLPRMLGIALRGLADGRLKVLAQSDDLDDLETLLAWVEDGSLRPHIGLELPLEEAPRGLELLDQGAVRGKIGLRIQPANASV